MGIRGRKEGGEGDHPYLSFFEKFWEKRAAKKGIILTLVFLRSFGRRELQRRGFVGDCFFF